MAISVFGTAHSPTSDNGTNGGVWSVTPPASMVAGDFVMLVVIDDGTAADEFRMSDSGGQSWTEFNQLTGAAFSSQIFWCIFSGSWSADPAMGIIGTGTVMNLYMAVFRGVDQVSPLDVGDTGATYSAPSVPPFGVTITGITTITANAMVVAVWTSFDNNTWGLNTAGWSNPNSETQWRSTDGPDLSISIGLKTIASPSGSGNVENDQLTLGGDEGSTNIFALKADTTVAGQPAAKRVAGTRFAQERVPGAKGIAMWRPQLSSRKAS